MEIDDLKERLRKSLQVIQKLQRQLDAARQVQQTAVIGVSCRLPGGLDNMDELWDFLYKGGNAITTYPQERLEALGYNEVDVANVKGGFIKDIELFDPAFFNIGLQEAAAMDPQHRMLLEMVWRAFEDAELDINAYKGKRVGVYIALSNNDYSLQRLRSDNTNPYDFTGNILAPAAGRISYAFDFRGPCSVVDTACSSALVAFHQAHTALNNHECDLAIVGGINLILDLGINKALQSIDALAADGYCKPLDASADGYTRSEGGGVLLLKRANEVDNTGKPYCIVKGSCLNHDGHSNGFTAPSGQAQEAVINGALKAAGLSSNDIDYIELHGTGTALGDPIEVDAIQHTFLNAGRSKPLYIGSVKSNMGHLECAAGLAGLFKSILVLKHKTIPPTIHIRKLNPLIEWQAGMEIPLMPERLPADTTRIGISSFGISGTNAHIIIESADEVAPLQQEETNTVHALLLSAATPGALNQLVEDYATFLQHTQHEWKHICAAAATRTQWAYRVAITASSCDEAVKKLQEVTRFDKEIQRKSIRTYTDANDLLNQCMALLDEDDKKQAQLLQSQNGQGIAALIALLYTAGIDCDWKILVGHSVYRIAVPGYSFKKIACWVKKEQKLQTLRGLGTACHHPVFTQQFMMPGKEDSFSFTGMVSLKDMFWLSGHQLFDTVIFPGAGFLDWMLFAAQKTGRSNTTISQLVLKEPLGIQADEAYVIWLQVEKTTNGYTCKVYSKIQGSDVANWVLHATADVVDTIAIETLIPAVDSESATELHVATFYKQCTQAGIGYSGAFAMLDTARLNGTVLEGIVKWQSPAANTFVLHPALLDNCFQLLGAYVMNGDTKDAYVPYKMDAVNSYGAIVDGDVEVLIQLPVNISHGFHSLKVDIAIWQHKELKAAIQGFNLVKVSREQLAPLLGNELNKHIYAEQWVDLDIQVLKSTLSEYVVPAFEHWDGDTVLAKRAATGLQQLDALAVNWVAHILHGLNIEDVYGKGQTANTLRGALKVQDNHSRLFERLLFVVVEQGWAVKQGDTYTFNNVPETNIDENIAPLQQQEHLLAELEVLNRCAGNIAAILKGEANPVEVLFPGGSIEYVKALYASDAFKVMHQLTAACFANFVSTNSDKGTLRILEIGAGTGSTTQHILPLLKGMNVVYDFTDISPLFLHEAKNAQAQYGFINYKVLDVEKDLTAQGYDLNSYDLIIASNVLHATRSLAHTFQQVQQLLKDDGALFMVEGTSKMLWIDLIFGITSGWWLFDDATLRMDHALLSTTQWNNFLAAAGFAGIQIVSPVYEGATSSGQSVIWASKKETSYTGTPVLLLPQDATAPEYLKDLEIAYIDDKIPAGKPLVISLENHHHSDMEALTDNSLHVYSLLSALRNDAPKTIILLATGVHAKAYTGFWRSLQNELQDWDIRLVITDGLVNADIILKTEIGIGAKDECSCWNNGKRAVLRLSQVEIPAHNYIDWKGKAVLITGGAGGVGQQLAQWLKDKGAHKVYITGRSSVWKGAGENSIYLQTDISKEIPQGIAEDIYAIFHLAGVVADNPFWKQDSNSLTAVLDPKVAGTDNVLKLAATHNTQHVVLFASSAAMLGTIGQTNHALACAYQQNIAGVQHDTVITSIAWGPWKGAGAVEKYNVDDIAARIGVVSTNADANFKVMEQLMTGAIRATGVVHVDWNKYATGMKNTPYWLELVAMDKTAAHVPTVNFEEVVNGGIDAIIDYLRNVVSGVLGYKEMQLLDADAGFFDIGLDSLTALDLKNKIQAILKEELPSTLVFKYPNIRSLATYISGTYKIENTAKQIIAEEQWDESVDALRFIEEEFNNLFDEGTAVK
jgi:acyl transferase domain-containing protein/NAD(P)-dependent dehydrogenase (short-subunit alcohol dehydrogenase family)/acyl carrier protein